MIDGVTCRYIGAGPLCTFTYEIRDSSLPDKVFRKYVDDIGQDPRSIKYRQYLIRQYLEDKPIYTIQTFLPMYEGPKVVVHTDNKRIGRG